ncbi:hypothetical protein K8R61_01450 [bacterium]|nr:hypothetical protein [bacterium]
MEAKKIGRVFTPIKEVNFCLTVLFIVLIISFLVYYLFAPFVWGKTYDGTDSRVFDKGTMIVYANNAHKKIVSPKQLWSWLNSGHVLHRQPGAVIRTARGHGGYTLTNSFDSVAAEELTWAHYSFFLYKGDLPEEYDPILPVEKRISKKLNQSARVIRIDKSSPNFYVVMYVRSHKEPELKEVDGYPPFNIPDSVGITNNGILADIRVKGFDYHRNKPFFTYKRERIRMNNVVWLNPTFFQNPTELKTIFIHYDFFKESFLFDHPEVAFLHSQSGDPVLMKITEDGIKLKFRKPVEYEDLE